MCVLQWRIQRGIQGCKGTPLSSRSLHAELGYKATYQSSSSYFQLITFS